MSQKGQMKWSPEHQDLAGRSLLPPQKGSAEVADVETELEKKRLGRTDDLLLLSLWPCGDLGESTGLDQLE